MTYRTSLALVGAFALVGNMAFAEDNEADATAQYSATDTYEIIEWGKAGRQGSGRLIPCELDDQGDIQCTGPTFPSSTDSFSALLYNQDQGGLVQCQFAKVETEAGHEDVFAQYDPQVFVEINQKSSHDYAQSVADMLRPSSEGVSNGVAEFGSCVAYETPVTDAQMDDIRAGTLNVPNSHYGLGDGGVDWDGPGGGFRGAKAFKDWYREDRLYMEYSRAQDAGSNALPVVESDIFGDGSFIHYYAHANLEACENTGDFSMADRIWDAVRADTTVSGIELRANCPAL